MKIIKILKIKYSKDIKYRKVRDHCHYTGENRGNVKHSVPKQIPIVF